MNSSLSALDCALAHTRATFPVAIVLPVCVELSPIELEKCIDLWLLVSDRAEIHLLRFAYYHRFR